jgi:hypothetical protein
VFDSPCIFPARDICVADLEVQVLYHVALLCLSPSAASAEIGWSGIATGLMSAPCSPDESVAYSSAIGFSNSLLPELERSRLHMQKHIVVASRGVMSSSGWRRLDAF